MTHGAILDGEAIVPTEAGHSDFAALESALSKKEASSDLLFYAFDILHLEVLDLRGCTLLDRKRVLHSLLENVKGPIRYSEHLEAEGREVLQSACEMELEGEITTQDESGKTDPLYAACSVHNYAGHRRGIIRSTAILPVAASRKWTAKITPTYGSIDADICWMPIAPA